LRSADVILEHLAFSRTIGLAGGRDVKFFRPLICLLAVKRIPENDCRFTEGPASFELPDRKLIF
jgi:hypothetical protein